MWKLNNLVISGFEVFNLPTPPAPQALLDEPGPAARKERRTRRPMSLLLHTLAVGGLPLPGHKR